MSLLREYYTRFPEELKAGVLDAPPAQMPDTLKLEPSADRVAMAQYGISPEVKGAEVLTLLRKGVWKSPPDADENAFPSSWPGVTAFPSDDNLTTSTSQPKPRVGGSAPRPASLARAARTRPHVYEEDDDGDYPSPGQSPALASSFGGSSPGNGHKEKDKEWAALTTWLRMNLHQPRTAKRKVLFVGTLMDDGEWVFDLNEAITWDDVSADTKTRLKTLVEETEAAFVQKYPSRRVSDWKYKIQKYRLPGGSRTYMVPLADVVYSLQEIYFQNHRVDESAAAVEGAVMDMDEDEGEGVAGVAPARWGRGGRRSRGSPGGHDFSEGELENMDE
mmetsp:Transcript_35009/g.110629  ORF Transcript_35009/g.110629 Transcript_35009/m.110629 type:complete len:332 (-) Transcript_35009:221-1216(-)